jgi:hypothetical protein
VFPEEQGRRPGRRHDDAVSVVVARPPSRSYTGEGGVIVLTAERPSTSQRRRRGCSNRPTDAATRRAPQAPSSEDRSSSKARRSRSSRMGKIYWGRARRRWRRLEAEVMKPHGQEEARDEAEQRHHQAAADLAGARRSQARSSSAIQESPEGD